jgi:hypothetical protein
MIHNCGILDKAKLRANNAKLAAEFARMAAHQEDEESETVKQIIRGMCRVGRSPCNHG